jgi:hypothetical protein
MDRGAPLDTQGRHQWDIDHPYIKRVPNGWQQKEAGPRDHREMWDYYSAHDPELRTHPALYKLFGQSYTDWRPRDLARHLRIRFVYNQVVTDAELAELPDPPRWPKPISDRWPELKRRRNKT